DAEGEANIAHVRAPRARRQPIWLRQLKSLAPSRRPFKHAAGSGNDRMAATARSRAQRWPVLAPAIFAPRRINHSNSGQVAASRCHRPQQAEHPRRLSSRQIPASIGREQGGQCSTRPDGSRLQRTPRNIETRSLAKDRPSIDRLTLSRVDSGCRLTNRSLNSAIEQAEQGLMKIRIGQVAMQRHVPVGVGGNLQSSWPLPLSASWRKADRMDLAGLLGAADSPTGGRRVKRLGSRLGKADVIMSDRFEADRYEIRRQVSESEQKRSAAWRKSLRRRSHANIFWVQRRVCCSESPDSLCCPLDAVFDRPFSFETQRELAVSLCQSRVTPATAAVALAFASDESNSVGANRSTVGHLQRCSLAVSKMQPRNDELLRQLSQHSLMFSGSRQPKPQPAPPASRSPASTSTAVATSTTNSSSGAAAYADSLTDRALQAMEASAKRQTVRVDLRHSQAASLQMSDLLRFGPTLLDSSEAKANATAAGDNHRESSSEDEDDSAAGESLAGLVSTAKQAGWPANSQANLKRPPAQKVSTTAFAGTKTSPVAGGDAASDKDSQPVPAVSQKRMACQRRHRADSINCLREAELSRRRSLLLALRDLAPNLVAVGLEPVAHDDVSFTEPAPEPLDPSCRQSENLLLLEARLSPCGQLLGVNGQPLDVVDTARDASYHCLLVWLLSLSAAQPKPTDPLHILGLRQLADSGSGQLRLQVAAHANRDMPLHRYLSDTNLHQACSA
uniref:RING-type domain-containing protein n=1 Tax=Macrostomum lignano TaxID=282301 RepID=A0A1I8F5K8_9PLAT